MVTDLSKPPAEGSTAGRSTPLQEGREVAASACRLGDPRYCKRPPRTSTDRTGRTPGPFRWTRHVQPDPPSCARRVLPALISGGARSTETSPRIGARGVWAANASMQLICAGLLASRHPHCATALRLLLDAPIYHMSEAFAHPEHASTGTRSKETRRNGRPSWLATQAESTPRFHAGATLLLPIQMRPVAERFANTSNRVGWSSGGQVMDGDRFAMPWASPSQTGPTPQEQRGVVRGPQG